MTSIQRATSPHLDGERRYATEALVSTRRILESEQQNRHSHIATTLVRFELLVVLIVLSREDGQDGSTDHVVVMRETAIGARDSFSLFSSQMNLSCAASTIPDSWH